MKTYYRLTVLISLIIGFLLGMSFQYKMDHATNQKLMDHMQQKYNDLTQKYISLKKIIQPFKKIAGLTDMQGEGLIIDIETPSQNKNATTNFDLNKKDISQMVNTLWVSGADAIALNGSRLNINSLISSKNNSIYINQTQVTLPFTILVIGDKQEIYTKLTDPNSILSTLKNKKIKIKINYNDNIIIKRDPNYLMDKNFNKLDL